MINKSDAVLALRPEGGFKVDEDGTVTYLIPNQTEPSEEQIQAKLTELQADYEANQYQRDRAADYPSWQEQMDLLYHGGVDALKAELKKTKDKFPKPS